MMLDTTLNTRIQGSLDKFDAALAAGDIDAAVGMFAPIKCERCSALALRA
jgi:putative flavoprotein involved in K+ transport